MNIPNTFERILLVRTDRIGDVVLTTPSIKALREKFPHAKIAILVSPQTQDLVQGNPYLDDVLVDDRLKDHAGWIGFFKLVTMIKKKNFDLAVIFHTKKRTNALCFLAGIPYRLGYKNNKWGGLLNFPLEDKRHLGEHHEVEYCLELLKPLGVSSQHSSWEMYIPIHQEAEKWVETFLKEKRISSDRMLMAIHPGASDPSKQWPVHKFIELMRLLRRRYSCQFVLIGAASVRLLAKEIITHLPDGVWDVTGQTTIGQLTSLLRRCRMLISNDSGPVHLAAALQVTVVSIFTRNQPGISFKRWKPLGEKTRFISVPYDDSFSFKKAGSASSKYLELIPTQQVFEEVDALLKVC